MFVEQEVKLYAEVASLDELTGIVETALEEYNNTHKNRMNLVIFRCSVVIQLDIIHVNSCHDYENTLFCTLYVHSLIHVCRLTYYV